jgi:hypothetical protein
VLDSAPLVDAVATQDTVTLLRGAIRGLLVACPAELATAVPAVLTRDDDYLAAGKPVCDWDDPHAREQLVDALFRDGYRALGALRGRRLGPEVAQAAECWPPSSARTSRRPPMAGSSSPEGWHPTG